MRLKIILLFICLLLTGCAATTTTNLIQNLKRTTITFSSAPEVQFSVQIADTSEERAQGLMNVTTMPETEGMLFNFPEERILKFWMKNTLIPLDLVFIKNNTVTQVLRQLPPCQEEPCQIYQSIDPSAQAIELNAGVTAKYNIEAGTTITIAN